MIEVQVRFLAIPTGVLEESAWIVTVPAGTTVGELLGKLTEEYPVLSAYSRFVSANLNRTIVGMQKELHDGDQVVYSPPVGGGS